MRTDKRIQKEVKKESGSFAVIPMEKLSGLDETLWLDQMAENKAPNRGRVSTFDIMNKSQ